MKGKTMQDYDHTMSVLDSTKTSYEQKIAAIRAYCESPDVPRDSFPEVPDPYPQDPNER